MSAENLRHLLKVNDLDFLRIESSELLPLTTENWGRLTDAFTPKPPVTPNHEDVFFSFFTADEAVDIDALTFSYVDRATGRVRREFEYRPRKYKKDPFLDIGIAQDFSLKGVAAHEYLPETFSYPLLGEPISVTRIVRRYWDTDARGRKLQKAKLNVLRVLFGQKEGNAITPFILLSESEFNKIAGDTSELGQGERWEEIYRTFFFRNEHVAYGRRASGVLVRNDYRKKGEEGDYYVKGVPLLFPVALGQSEQISF